MDGLIRNEDLQPGQGKVIDGDRPSRHGQLLGEALALIADLGAKDSPVELERCATCAFRPGTVPNQTAGTGIMALNCVLGIDPDRFACHHGLKNGEPKRICAGYIAALIAPHSRVREILSAMQGMLQAVSGDDTVRAEFDAWLTKVDPDGQMDVYQVARAYEKRLECTGCTDGPKTDCPVHSPITTKRVAPAHGGDHERQSVPPTSGQPAHDASAEGRSKPALQPA